MKIYYKVYLISINMFIKIWEQNLSIVDTPKFSSRTDFLSSHCFNIFWSLQKLTLSYGSHHCSLRVPVWEFAITSSGHAAMTWKSVLETLCCKQDQWNKWDKACMYGPTCHLLETHSLSVTSNISACCSDLPNLFLTLIYSSSTRPLADTSTRTEPLMSI